MRLINLIFSLLFLVLSIQSCWASNNDSTITKAKKLKELYSKSTREQSSKEIYQQKFFDEFPNSFDGLVRLYGYEHDKPSILYNEAMAHIYELFNNLKVVNDTLYYQKIISIAVGGHWEADAESYFQEGLRSRVIEKPELVACLLSNKSHKVIESFWYFYFDGPHPVSNVPDELLVMKKIDANMYDLMGKALKNVQQEWKNQ